MVKRTKIVNGTVTGGDVSLAAETIAFTACVGENGTDHSVLVDVFRRAGER